MYFWHLFVTSLRASFAVRGAFLLSTGLMVGSNLVYYSMWDIFFSRFPRVLSWGLSDMVAMMAVVIGGMGLSKLIFGGTKQITKTITTGQLDTFLTQPKSVLLQICMARSQSKGWGQLFSAVAMMILAVSWMQMPMVIFAMICACLIFVSCSIMAHAVAFWMGPIEEISNKYSDTLFLFLHYPTNIYSGAMKFIMWTAFPIGVIGYLPVTMIQSFSWSACLTVAGSTCLFVAAAWIVFYRGLRRYESGNQISSSL